KSPIYCVAAHFCSFGTPYVWPHSQKHTAPCISALLLSHPVTFCETIKDGEKMFGIADLYPRPVWR
ncbi:MAG: hypothetical protein KKD63_00695, partial [Proteobacteria bacterium]|nr:hypothetical protein [Pseudomonadota bacterium]